MILIKIKKLDGSLLDEGKFQTEEEGRAWFKKSSDAGIYGEKGSFTVHVEDVTTKEEDLRLKLLAKEFLNSTDWRVLRYFEQKEAGIATSMTQVEFNQLVSQREQARTRASR